ncbi:MAG: hypothetical protein ABW223_08320 [Rariglobus sp.]
MKITLSSIALLAAVAFSTASSAQTPPVASSSQPATSASTIKDEYWGYSFDDRALPVADLLAHREVRIFTGTIKEGPDGGSALQVSQRWLAALDSEALFDRTAALMTETGQPMMGTKKAIVIGGLPAVWATFVDGKNLIIMAATKAKAGERSWWFYGKTMTDPALATSSAGAQLGVIRQSILNFKVLGATERAGPQPDVYVLPGRFQIKTSGFSKIDGSLVFAGSERKIEAPLNEGGGRVATFKIVAIPRGQSPEEALNELRKQAEAAGQTVTTLTKTQVSGRDAHRISLKGAPNQESIEALWVWDTDLVWKVTVSGIAEKQKSRLLAKELARALASFQLLGDTPANP